MDMMDVADFRGETSESLRTKMLVKDPNTVFEQRSPSFRVANATLWPIKILYRAIYAPGETDKLALEFPLLSANYSDIISAFEIGIKTYYGEKSFVGNTVEFWDRAVIVTEGGSIKRSILLNTGRVADDIWISEGDNVNHYPKRFYVSNASSSPVRVVSMIQCATVEDRQQMHSVKSGEYRQFQGVHAHILNNEHSKIYDGNVEEQRSIIIRSSKNGDHVLSEIVSHVVDGADSIWKGSDKINYNPRGLFYVANASDFPVTVTAFTQFSEYDVDATKDLVVEPGNYSMLLGCRVTIRYEHETIYENYDVDNISVIVRDPEIKDCIVTNNLDFSSVAKNVWIGSDGKDYKPKKFYVLNECESAIFVTSRNTAAGDFRRRTCVQVQSSSKECFFGCQVTIQNNEGKVIYENPVPENNTVIVKSLLGFLFSCNIIPEDGTRNQCNRCHIV